MRVQVTCDKVFICDHMVSDYLAGGTFQVSVHTGPEDLPESSTITREALDFALCAFLSHGAKVTAIKLLRMAWPGLSLRDAKFFIDGYTTHHRRDLQVGESLQFDFPPTVSTAPLPPQRVHHFEVEEGVPACF